MSNGAGAFPNFLIIGAARAGTTALHRYLAPHPDVFLARPKELHFFDNHFAKGADWYRDRFEGVGGQRAVGEASPSYMYSSETMQRMASLLPEARLVAILRHPVDRAYSHYWMNRWQGRETLSFTDAVAAEPGRLQSGDSLARRFAYLDRGRYHRQLLEVCRRYPRHQLLVLLFDDLRDSPLPTYQELCRFLDIDDSYFPDTLGAAVNSATALRSVALWRLSRRLPTSMSGVGRTIRRLNEHHVPYPPLPEALRQELLAGYEQDNAALAEWLGRDLSPWSS